ncbi:hypothetical protein Q8A67_015423 [Cirrhinus molitorella]|uniref:Uncharacterized protein n=1 Tax=Cirrhinus molitorella TaxID=172907 RepID=A0AA88TK30_9TELE|nr:hypothetical protein Q8A67_015423 [Cirrhinus molitorella]
MDLTARRQTSGQDRNDEKTAKRKDTHSQTSISDSQHLRANMASCLPLRCSWCICLPERNEDTPVSMDSCSATNIVSEVGSHVNSESPSDISTSIDTGLMDGSRAELHTPGQEMALMSPLFCSNVASGGEQTKMDLALWEINIVLRVELWDTGSQRGARRYMAKWQLSDGNILLAEDFWLPGVTD